MQNIIRHLILSLACCWCSLCLNKSEDITIFPTPFDPIDEWILCRRCGANIADTHKIFHKLSPKAHLSFNDTLFEKEKVHIQVLINKFAIPFPVITVTESYCEGIGEWVKDEAWFPGFLVRPCVCPECGMLHGWEFHPAEQDVDSPLPFYSLIVNELIGETFTNSLIKIPKY